MREYSVSFETSHLWTRIGALMADLRHPRLATQWIGGSRNIFFNYTKGRRV